MSEDLKQGKNGEGAAEFFSLLSTSFLFISSYSLISLLPTSF